MNEELYEQPAEETREELCEESQPLDPIPETPAAPAAPQSGSILFSDKPTTPCDRLPTYTPTMALGIISMIVAFLIPLAGDITAIVGLCMASGKSSEYTITGGKVCCIIGLVLSILNHIAVMAMMLSA